MEREQSERTFVRMIGAERCAAAERGAGIFTIDLSDGAAKYIHLYSPKR